MLLAAVQVNTGVVSASRIDVARFGRDVGVTGLCQISAVPLAGMSGVIVPPEVVAVEVDTTVSRGRAAVATASDSWHSKASPVAAMTMERLLESAAAC